MTLNPEFAARYPEVTHTKQRRAKKYLEAILVKMHPAARCGVLI
jgi:hypothetical protein